MNNRIKELVNKSFVISTYGDIEFANTRMVSVFAELIIKECSTIADDWYQHHDHIDWTPGDHIKQHLGVEQ